MIRLIASDMDGTLLNSEKKTPRGLKGVVSALQRRKYRFKA